MTFRAFATRAKNRATQTCYTKIESLKPNKFDMFYVICHFEDKKQAKIGHL